MAEPAAVTDQGIKQQEQARGALAWTGPEGAADAFALMGHHWNSDIYTTIASLNISGYALERIG